MQIYILYLLPFVYLFIYLFVFHSVFSTHWLKVIDGNYKNVSKKPHNYNDFISIVEDLDLSIATGQDGCHPVPVFLHVKRKE